MVLGGRPSFQSLNVGAKARPPVVSWACCLSHSASKIITCAGRPSLPKARRGHFCGLLKHVSREQNNVRLSPPLREVFLAHSLFPVWFLL